MIRHIVMFEFAERAGGHSALENAVKAKDMLLALVGKIEVIRHMEVGINEAEADQTNDTLCLMVDVDSLEDLQVYAQHPEHLKVAAFIATVKLSRTCVDYEIDENER